MINAIVKNVGEGKVVTIGMLFALFLFFITGCATPEATSSTDLFAFDIPSGFSISNNSEQECAIIDSEGVVVGGFIITNLSLSDLKDEEGVALPQYLNSTHWGCEYFSWVGNDPEKPAQYVTQYVNTENTEEAKIYYRVLFESNSYIYDMWFDTDLIGEEAISEFVSTIVEQ